MPRVHSHCVADLELRRRAGHCLALQVGGALQRGFGRHLRAGRRTRHPGDVFLLARNGARVRNPRADGLPGRHGVGLDHQRLGHLDAARHQAGRAGSAGGGDDLLVVRVQMLVRAILRHRGIGCAPGACLRADPEQVGGRAFEVAALAIDIEVLDQAGGVPAREVVFAKIGNLLAQLRLGSRRIQGEVQAHAAHAFALEGIGLTIGCRQARILQRRRDVGLGLRERTAVDPGDHRRQRGRRSGQPPRRCQQTSAQAPDSRQRQSRFAHHRIHGDTSQGAGGVIAV